MKKYLIIIIALFIFVPLKVKADDCTAEEKGRLKLLASHISTTYEYKEKNGEITFDITFNNVHKDLVIVDNNSGKMHITNKKGLSNITIKGFEPGSNYSFRITSNNKCLNKRVGNIYLELPHYNKYYKDSVCNNSSNILCGKWMNTDNYSLEEFRELINSSKKTEEKEEVQQQVVEETFLTKIGDFFYKYYSIILLFIIMVCLVFIYVLNKRNSFDLK